MATQTQSTDTQKKQNNKLDTNYGTLAVSKCWRLACLDEYQG